MTVAVQPSMGADTFVTIQRQVHHRKPVPSRAATPLLDPEELAEQVGLYRVAAKIGLDQTTARSTKLMKKRNARPGDSSTATTTTELHHRHSDTAGQQRF